MADKRRVFITMRSTGDMTIFDWERHIEEVQAALIATVIGEEWEQLHIYGPNTGGFSPPAMCIEVEMTMVQVGNFLERLAVASPWLSVPVEINVATTAMSLTGEAEKGDTDTVIQSDTD